MCAHRNPIICLAESELHLQTLFCTVRAARWVPSAELYIFSPQRRAQRACRGITCERWVQALALPDQDALYNATFYFPVLNVRPWPTRI